MRHIKLLIILLFIPVFAFSQDRKYIELERQSPREWNLYDVDMSDFYNMYNAGGLKEYHFEFTTSPTYNFWDDYTYNQGTIINLFDDSEGYLKYTESIHIETNQPDFWELEWQKTQKSMMLDIDW